jgi:hypothetical protein
VVDNYFLQQAGTYFPRLCKLNMLELGWEPRQLDHMDLPFTEPEIQSMVKHSPKEKAPGPDGFICLFFSECWNHIKEDLIRAVQLFYLINHQNLHLLNQSYVVLIPKKGDPEKISDYMPINLTHNFIKIVSKLMTNRLGPELRHIISHPR